MTDLEKLGKAIAYLRSRKLYVVEGGAVSWNPTKVDVKSTIAEERARLSGKRQNVTRLRR